jgi:glucose-6-phosphate 1-dehydrogenase
MMQRALVIFGGTGDLARRMLFPALYFLEAEGLLPAGLRIFGTGRSAMDAPAFQAMVEEAVRARAGARFDGAVFGAFAARLAFAKIDASVQADFDALARAIGLEAETTFFLSTSPSVYGAIAGHLAAAGLAHERARIVLEKPIGRDLISSRAINEAVGKVFAEERIFRIDHYLGKETVQNLLALRFANTLFEPLWNANSIEHVQITIAETVGLEGRASYYDEYGALRDMVQNHLLQLVCLIAMEPPASLDPEAVRNEKVKVLRCLRPFTQDSVAQDTVRGQYRAGAVGGAAVKGYHEEMEGFAARAETFVAIRAHIDNWRWAGVPFYLRTGKRLAQRRTQVFIQFRQVPHSIFPRSQIIPNSLIIDLQPDECISLQLMNSTPGLARDGLALRQLPLNLSFDAAYGGADRRRRIAYERLLLDALEGRSTLFVRRDEIEAAWGWIDGLVAGWEILRIEPKPYPAGTWGPQGAAGLVERHQHSWQE